MAKTKEEINLIAAEIDNLLKDLDGEDIVRIGKLLEKYKKIEQDNEVSVNFEQGYEISRSKDLTEGFNNY